MINTNVIMFWMCVFDIVYMIMVAMTQYLDFGYYGNNS